MTQTNMTFSLMPTSYISLTQSVSSFWPFTTLPSFTSCPTVMTSDPVRTLHCHCWHGGVLAPAQPSPCVSPFFRLVLNGPIVTLHLTLNSGPLGIYKSQVTFCHFPHSNRRFAEKVPLPASGCRYVYHGLHQITPSITVSVTLPSSVVPVEVTEIAFLGSDAAPTYPQSPIKGNAPKFSWGGKQSSSSKGKEKKKDDDDDDGLQ
jgi:hypothetical protein